MFGIGRNQVCQRAVDWVQGGHINVQTLSIGSVILRHNKHDVLIVRMLVTPSHKSKDYWVMLCFDITDGGAYLPEPISWCECPCGCGPCSHKIAVAGVIHLVQHYTQWTFNDVENALPPPLKSVPSVPIPWHFAFGKSDSSKAAKLAKQACLEFCKVSGGSGESLQEALNEDEEKEVAAALACDEEGMNQVDVCGQIIASLAAAMACAKVKGQKQKYEHPLDLQAIWLANIDQRKDVGGPNENVAAKLKQLLMLQRLDDAVASGKLKHWMLLSHYTLEMRKARARHIKQLAFLVANAKEDCPLTNLQCLMKIPPEKTILANRLYNKCSPYLPNFNEHITPHRLHSRTHFNVDELEDDESPKKMQYPSETNFSHYDDIGILRDKVPWGCFSILSYALNWAYCHANLQLPFYYTNPQNYGHHFHMIQAEGATKKQHKAELKKTCTQACIDELCHISNNASKQQHAVELGLLDTVETHDKEDQHGE